MRIDAACYTYVMEVVDAKGVKSTVEERAGCASDAERKAMTKGLFPTGEKTKCAANAQESVEAEQVDLITKLGRWDIRELPDGSLSVRMAEGTHGQDVRMTVMPHSTAHVVLGATRLQ